ncbi:MAG TPA: tryptophan--tRNA ligase [Candidatus Thermoplasmatota archaeon]|nr:tryptophan--tRNA ligase [Candidatus Thermoplasmatota archaeon]
MRIDPWGANAVQDYARLRDEFGIAPFGADEWGAFPDAHPLFRRGVVFGHRDFERVAEAVRRHDPWAVMTGFMPSGDLHLGHKMVLEQVIAHQKAGADIHLALADFEAIAARGFTPEKAERVALDQYVHNALALGLSTKGAEFYFQTRRTRVKNLAHRFAEKVNWSTLQALYGFSGETSMAHALAPLVQAADILHVQGSGMGGPRPVLVPVGVDQDPHIRLTRDLAQDCRLLNVQEVKGEGLGVFAKVDEGVKGLLDLAEKTLRAEGYGELRRNDAYKALYVKGAGPGDLRRIDLALAKAEQAKAGGLGLVRPSATFHRFMTGLQGGKMSSSKPESSIYLTEEPKSAEKKLMASVTGGRATAEEQRRLGANPDICPVYEMYLYHLAKDDRHLQEVHATCKSGARLCGGCKKEAAGLLLPFLMGHKERRDEVAHLVKGAVAAD